MYYKIFSYFTNTIVRFVQIKSICRNDKIFSTKLLKQPQAIILINILNGDIFRALIKTKDIRAVYQFCTEYMFVINIL